MLRQDPSRDAGASLIASLTSIMAASPENAAIQTVTPNRLRGQITFLFLFIMNVVGMGAGPIIVGAISQYVVGEANIRYSLVITGALVGSSAATPAGTTESGRGVASTRGYGSAFSSDARALPIQVPVGLSHHVCA